MSLKMSDLRQADVLGPNLTALGYRPELIP